MTRSRIAPHKPGKIRTAIHQVVEGAIRWSVSAPDVYTGNPAITYQFGPDVIVFSDEESVRCFLAASKELEQYADRIYPNLDAALDRQRRQRQQMLGREGTDNREYLNGGQSRLERAMTQARRDAEMAEPIRSELNGGGMSL